ncbi:uncharacterized protein LOC128556929 [Mercenaria mercenaria]|uniref:uncharacterized protein LOC128556929 n=1 Tax=Mercenaria mercenaria TaxID=6596 RepID=UPI00234F826C|nr:uncharacterized protein LOC128556929 [Mercenaria mercenaria]XP_053398923.1 uncharacterized protein LOC128556929 [Mercenaria mercenaria]XP_053398927.1 uncharacterized protein LOC128556929 [Mercenaria mercenaria]XP_053398930.1 uncharacterized protein LOC128556929 [Mercenaria mercenaria]
MSYDRKELVKVQLSVYKPIHDCPGRYKDYFVAVVGPGLQLGNEDPNNAARCNPEGHHVWTITLWLPKGKDVYFKFLLVHASTYAVVDVEEIIPHRIRVGQKPLRVEMTYNKTTTLVEEAGDDFKAIDKEKYGLYHIPTLNIERSDRVQFKAPNVECPPELTHSGKSELEAASQVVVLDDNIETTLPPGHKQLVQNESCTKHEMYLTEEIKPVSQDEMTIQLDGTVSNVKEKENMTNAMTQRTMTSPKQGVTRKEENMKNLPTPPNNCTTSEATEKVEKVTNHLTQPPIQKEQNMTKPWTKPTRYTSQNISTIKTAIVKPLSYEQQQQQQKQQHFSIRKKGSDFPVSEGLILVAAGVAFASYVGYRVFRTIMKRDE